MPVTAKNGFSKIETNSLSYYRKMRIHSRIAGLYVEKIMRE